MSTPIRSDRSILLSRLSGSTVKYVSLMLGVLVTILPLTVVFIASFKTSAEFGQTGPFDPPSSWFNLENYVVAFEDGGMVVVATGGRVVVGGAVVVVVVTTASLSTVVAVMMWSATGS